MTSLTGGEIMQLVFLFYPKLHEIFLLFLPVVLGLKIFSVLPVMYVTIVGTVLLPKQLKPS